jgi:hypothetical protein
MRLEGDWLRLMKPRTAHLPLIALLLVLAALPARTQVQSLALTAGPGKLIDSLIAAGYGGLNLYNTLVTIQNNTNPAVTGVITPAFLATLQSCPASSPLFTTTLSNYTVSTYPGGGALDAWPGGGVLVSTDCTVVETRDLNPSGYNGLTGYNTLATSILGLSGLAAVITPTNPATPIAVFDPTGDYTCYVGAACHHVFAIIYEVSGPLGGSQSFVLSDEAPGRLITNLVAAGYGNTNLYEVLLSIQQNTSPSLAGVLTPSFLAMLESCPAGVPIFTTPLKNLSYSGSGLAVSDDCSVQVRSVQGSSFNGQPGTTSLATTISGVGSATDVSSTSSTPLTSWTQNVTVGSSTATVTYNDFAVLYTPGSTPTTPATVPTLSQWGMLLLAGLLTGAAALELRRRTRRASVPQR